MFDKLLATQKPVSDLDGRAWLRSNWWAKASPVKPQNYSQ